MLKLWINALSSNYLISDFIEQKNNVDIPKGTDVSIIIFNHIKNHD